MSRVLPAPPEGLASDRMAKALLGIAESAESEAVKLRAIIEALDRAGLTARTAVDVTLGEPAPWQQMITGIARMPLEESQRRRGLIPEPLALPAGDPSSPVDAEVVPVPEPPAQPDGPLRPPPWAGEPPPPSSQPGTSMPRTPRSQRTCSAARLPPPAPSAVPGESAGCRAAVCSPAVPSVRPTDERTGLRWPDGGRGCR